ncbi:hypothetical protein SAMN05421823_106173 [Catalinimonas alkaloidigena]|uniref:Aminoglycoside phosphotransferase domain-containing protein n=1 Tax=Catalinimonas alkaloidigena TaxID=1075417 RepID=A0A1G9KI66_9BACT|nr:AAA family ATPase [Catalinimonas alkaloidigena]SDL49560.1 hypothetical protein SAMN05421823_106173 [Catalinimonas alkaloidigena]
MDDSSLQTPSADDLLLFLEQPASYPHGPAAVEVRQTHASLLALAGPYVYKVKKAVDFGFLDFTTLAKRRENAERERRLNSRLCADLYLDIVPICHRAGKLAFGSKGEIVEYALKMHRLDDGYFLDQLLKEGAPDPVLLTPVLDTLQAFYTQPPQPPALAAFGALSHIRRVTDDTLRALDLPEALPPVVYPTLRQYHDAYYEQHAALFAERVQQHRIVDGHGDLRLEHIHLQGGRVCIYDCLEFNDALRYLDVAADLAFLAMDLDFAAHPALARYVVDQMAQRLHDPALKSLMDFYKVYRACVRAKVEHLRSQEAEVGEAERQRSQVQRQRYLQLALRYATCGSSPTVLLVGGPIGSGKSTLARALADHLGLTYLSSDIVRKQQAHQPLFARTPASQRKLLYTPARTAAVYEALLAAVAALQAQEKGAVVDATFGNAAHRARFFRHFHAHRLPFFFWKRGLPPPYSGTGWPNGKEGHAWCQMPAWTTSRRSMRAISRLLKFPAWYPFRPRKRPTTRCNRRWRSWFPDRCAAGSGPVGQWVS